MILPENRGWFGKRLKTYDLNSNAFQRPNCQFLTVMGFQLN